MRGYCRSARGPQPTPASSVRPTPSGFAALRGYIDLNWPQPGLARVRRLAAVTTTPDLPVRLRGIFGSLPRRFCPWVAPSKSRRGADDRPSLLLSQLREAYVWPVPICSSANCRLQIGMHANRMHERSFSHKPRTSLVTAQRPTADGRVNWVILDAWPETRPGCSRLRRFPEATGHPNGRVASHRRRRAGHPHRHAAVRGGSWRCR